MLLSVFFFFLGKGQSALQLSLLNFLQNSLFYIKIKFTSQCHAAKGGFWLCCGKVVTCTERDPHNMQCPKSSFWLTGQVDRWIKHILYVFQQRKWVSRNFKLFCFQQPTWPFNYRFLSLRGTLECIMNSLMAPMHSHVQSDVDFRVFELHMNAPWSSLRWAIQNNKMLKIAWLYGWIYLCGRNVQCLTGMHIIWLAPGIYPPLVCLWCVI